MGTVEAAIRKHVKPGDELFTAVKRAKFVVAEVDQDGVVLLLGAKRAWTRLSWTCLESVVPFLARRTRVRISGTGYSTDIDLSALDGYLKQHVNRATAGSVAALLERAEVAKIDRSEPATIELAE